MIIENRFFRLEFTWWQGFRKRDRTVDAKLNELYKDIVEKGFLSTTLQRPSIITLLEKSATMGN
jgi:hypothetical protein